MSADPIAEYEGIALTVTLPAAMTEDTAERIEDALGRYADANGLEILTQFDESLAVEVTGGGEKGRSHFEAGVRTIVDGEMAKAAARAAR